MGQKHSALFMSSLFKKHFTLIILCLIFLIGIFFRFYRLSEFPVGFHLDEAINGVNGYFLSQTGRDSNNIKLPLQTEMFGDYNPTGYAYLSIIPIRIFGLTEFATRFPGALLGSLTILAIFLFTYSIFSDKKIALLSSLFVTISPWHVILSRSGEQTLAALFFVILGLSLVISSLSKRRPLLYLISGMIILSVSFFMYFTPRVFVPLALFIFFICFFSQIKQLNQKYKLTFATCFLLLIFLGLFLSLFLKGGGNRFNQLSIFNFQETKLVMEEQIREDGVLGKNVIETRAFHNKIINYSLAYLSNYFDYFSANFLFLKGGLPSWLKVTGLGYVYLIELPFLAIGIINLAKNKDKRYYFPILWLLIAPLTAAITVDETPNIRRSLVMFPVIEVISAYGLLVFLKKKGAFVRNLLIFFIGLILAFNFAYFLHQYFGHEKVHRTWYRGNGVPMMIEDIKKVYTSYDKVVISKFQTTYPFFLFYMKYDPKTYLLEGHTKDKEYTGFGKFFFVPQGCPAVERNDRFPKVGRVLYVNSPECKDSMNIQYHDVYREDGTRAFRIVYD